MWYKEFTSTIREHGFLPSRVMPCLWYKLSKDKRSYDYLSHHVDDFLHTSEEYKSFLLHLRKKYTVTGGEFPEVHLGMNIRQNDEGHITMSWQDNLGKAIERVKSLTKKEEIKPYDSTTKDNWAPETDNSPLLDEAGRKLFQRLIGIGIWLVCIGRFDIHFTINQLSRFTQSPRKGHLEDAIRVFGYLWKWVNKGVTTQGKTTVGFWDQIDSRMMTYPGYMKEYYPDSTFEDLAEAPPPMGPEVEVNIFVDASHADDKSDRKSVTGVFVYVRDMMVKSISKRQKSVATSK